MIYHESEVIINENNNYNRGEAKLNNGNTNN